MTCDTGIIPVTSEHYECRTLLWLGFLYPNSTRSLVDGVYKNTGDPARTQMTKIK